MDKTDVKIEINPYTDNDIMPWGKYKGWKMSEIPDWYLKWIYGNYHLSTALKMYIEENMQAIEENIKREQLKNK